MAYNVGDVASLLGSSGGSRVAAAGDLFQRRKRPRQQPVALEALVEARVKEKAEKKAKKAAAASTAASESAAEKSRTIFVGNLPVSLKKKHVVKFFGRYGKVENVRLRSMAVKGVKIDDAGNQDLVRKVAANRGEFDTDLKKSCNAYLRFEDAGAAERALEADGAELGDRHIRVDRLGESKQLFNAARSLFLGGLPYDIDEEDVRSKFAEVLGAAHGDDVVQGVRLIRDKDTLLGKGFGYLLLSSKAAVADALRLPEVSFGSRVARLQTCGRRFKSQSAGASLKPQKKRKDKRKAESFEGARASELDGARRRLANKRIKKGPKTEQSAGAKERGVAKKATGEVNKGKGSVRKNAKVAKPKKQAKKKK